MELIDMEEPAPTPYNEYSPQDMIELLADYRAAKRDVSDLRTEMVKVIVEKYSVVQEEAKRMDVETFFDGVLSGLGYKPTNRRT